MFFQYERILREQGALIIFSQEPYTHKLRSIDYPNLDFSYPLIWEKNIFANPFCSHKAPVSYFEDINVFRKKYDRQLKNPIRKYSKKILMYIGKSCHKINIDMGNRKLEHFLGYSSMQFNLPTNDSYNKLTSLYNLKQMDGYLSMNKLKQINERYQPTFNNGGSALSNIFKYKRERIRFHPTQKPVALLDKLIKTYTNENDLVLDNCMGSGTTGVACVNTGRNFIGMELDKEYFKIAEQRINEARHDVELF